ncbi:MAG: deoxyribodipyrimidine photo-lyase [Alkalibacterium sp.]|nr:deoxyribodipyrimidine photo-lyase [Alkalibacterium sp.]
MASVMWFRRDLRLEDNVALKQALEESDELLLLFHVNPDQFLGEGSSNQAAFFKSVDTFRKEIEEKGGRLHLLYGDLKECFKRLKDTFVDWTDIYVNRDEKGYGLKRDKIAGRCFKELGITAHGYYDHHIHHAGEIKTNSGSYYKVFTPYFNKWKELQKPGIVKVKFDASKINTELLFKDDSEQFESFLDKQMPLEGLEVGTHAASERLKSFVDSYLSEYKEARDFPMKDATSHLSHHLRLGEVSIRTVYAKVRNAEPSIGRDTFIQELAWRDFYNMIYATYPEQKEQAIKEAFRQIDWDNNEENYQKWADGQTGYPIVDAAMRQLNETGWMHNRLRMITASFLTKDLLIDWRWGEKYFQQKLIDYDPASNIGGWQWAASTGTDGVPYFRIFNPTTQSEKYDQSGDFIRQYVPELKTITNKKIHDPSKLTVEEQEAFSVIVGHDYPAPIVSHKRSRELAIQAFENSKKAYESAKSDE